MAEEPPIPRRSASACNGSSRRAKRKNKPARDASRVHPMRAPTSGLAARSAEWAARSIMAQRVRRSSVSLASVGFTCSKLLHVNLFDLLHELSPSRHVILEGPCGPHGNHKHLIRSGLAPRNWAANWDKMRAPLENQTAIPCRERQGSDRGN